jgi:hypothetical protein
MRPTKCYYGENEDYYDYEEEVVSVSNSEVLDALAEILVSENESKELSVEERKVCEGITRKLIKDMEIQLELEEQYRDELKEYFEGYRE